MKTKLYRNKGLVGRTYLKTVGCGFETGFLINGSPVFVGNFIHSKEATLWFNLMNREIRTFSRKYSVGTRFPVAWFKHFIANHLYKSYYMTLDRLFAKYNRTYTRAVMRDLRVYRKLRKNWVTRERSPFLKAA